MLEVYDLLKPHTPQSLLVPGDVVEPVREGVEATTRRRFMWQ